MWRFVFKCWIGVILFSISNLAAIHAEPQEVQLASEDGAFDSNSIPMLSEPPGLPAWSNTDIDALLAEIAERIAEQPSNTSSEWEWAMGNYIGQAIVRGIALDGLLRLDDRQIVTDGVARSAIDIVHFCEILRADSMGESYEPSVYADNAREWIEAHGGSIEGIQPTESVKNDRATPSGQYYRTTFTQGLTLLSSPTVIWLGSSGTYDNEQVDVPIGFNFYFYGDSDPDANTSVRVSSNGYISFFQQGGGALIGTDATNDAIATATDPDGMIAGWWDDLVVTNQGTVDQVAYKTEGSVGSRIFTVEYFSVSRLAGDVGDYRYVQIKLFETSNQIELHYGTWVADASDNATSGLEDYSGADGECGPNCLNSNSTRPSNNYRYTRPVAGERCVDPYVIVCGNTNISGGNLAVKLNNYDQADYGCGTADFSGNDEAWKLDVGTTCQDVTVTLNDSLDAAIDLIIDDSCPPDGYPIGCHDDMVTFGARGIVYIYVDCPAGTGNTYTLSVTCSSSAPATLNVPGTYATIQGAIDAACDGDTVMVADGTYSGNGDWGLDFHGKSITVRSQNGSSTCTIDCGGDDHGFYFHSGETSTSKLDGFTITNGLTGIYISASSPTIKDCIIQDFTAGVGINNGNPKLSGCTIQSCSMGGIFGNGSSSPTIEQCTISDCSHASCITLSNAGSTGRITDCIVSNAGSGYSGIHLTGATTIPISGCTISNNVSYGIYCASTDTSPMINDNDFLGNGTFPVYLYARNIPNLGTPINRYLYNTANRIYVVGDTVATDSIWLDQGIPYYLSGDITVQGNDGADNVTTLTLSPGAELVFGSQNGLYIGHDSNASLPGALNAVGTVGEHITFTGYSASSGYWDGIYFANYASDALCRLEYCDISYGGYSSYENIYCSASSPTISHCSIQYGSGANIFSYDGSNPVIDFCEIGFATGQGVYIATLSSALISNSQIHHSNDNGVYQSGTTTLNLTDCIISNNSSTGLFCNDSSDAATVSGCSFVNNTSFPIRILASQSANISNCSFTENGVQRIRIIGNTIALDTTWRNHGIPYYIDSEHLYVQGRNGSDSVTTLTLEPGVEVQFNANYLWIGHDSSATLPGALIANGTALQPIRFTSSQTTPVPGDWYGLYFANYSSDIITSLQNCIIEYGGYSTHENVVCSESAPTLQNCTIQYGSGSGVNAISNNANPTLIDCTIQYNTTYGVLATPGTVQMIGGIVQGNDSGGIRINTNAAASGVTHISGATFLVNDDYGILISDPSSDPVITDCIFQPVSDDVSGFGIYSSLNAVPVIGNSAADMNSFSNQLGYAVYSNSSTNCISARHNYWGAPGGPMDTGFGTDGCVNTGNINPSAARVSENVDYTLWENVDVSPTPTPVPCLQDGDVNNDHQITVTDAQLAFMIYLGTHTPTYEEECSADCNDSGSVTVNDAQCIFQNFLGAGCSCADPLSKRGNGQVNQKSGQSGLELSIGEILESGFPIENLAEHNLIWIDDIRPCNEDRIEIFVRISNPDSAVDALGLEIDYCCDRLRFLECLPGSPDRSWVLFNCSESEDGRLRLGCFSNPQMPIPTGSNEILAMLTFEIIHENCSIGDRCDLRFMGLTDDVAGWTGLSGSFVYCEIEPLGIRPVINRKLLWLPAGPIECDSDSR